MGGDVGRFNGLSQAEPKVSALRASIPSAAASLNPESFGPIIRRATEQLYEKVMRSCEDYLRDNVEFNIGSHLSMLELENQRMRTELYEVDRALGCMSMGHGTRLATIKETQERFNQASSEAWRLRKELASGIEARSDETRSGSAVGESPSDAQGDKS